MNPLMFKLTILKKMLGEIQEALDEDYQTDESLQEVIDICNEAIIMYATILTKKEKL